MTDLDREVRGLLRERAGREEVPRELPIAVRRRIRARQSGVVAGVVAMILVIAVPIVAAPGWFDRKDDNRHGETTNPVTSTVYGVSITFPDDWTLLQLNDRLEMGGTETSSLLQLSNFDPLDGRTWVCPLPGGSIPEGGVILFVQELLNWDRSVPLWPVELSSGSATFDTCGRRMARWQVDGRTFEAGVVGDLDGPAYRHVVTAFRSMAFEPPDDDPPIGNDTTTTDLAYVVASGRENGEPWNLLAFRYRDISDNVLCILLDPIGPRQGSCLPNPVQNYPFAFELSAEEVGGTLFAFGKAPLDAADIRTLTGRSLHLERLPAGLRFPFATFIGPADAVAADGTRLVEVQIIDAADASLDRQQWIESGDRDGPDVIAFDHAIGDLWWIAHEEDSITLKSRKGVLESISAGNLPGGEHLRVASHTFTDELSSGTEYETVVFGVSSSVADQVTLVLTTGTAQHASVRILAHQIEG
ncbi:MAG: hypothetical protein ACRDO9_09970, partial [Gaiellales bacterium]